MNLYVWWDLEHRKWAVSHFPPANEEQVLMVAVSPGADLMFLNHVDMEEIVVQVRP